MVSFADIQAAAERIRPHVHRTPVATSRTLDQIAGKRVFLKCENLQRGGAFKIRGATNFVLSIPDSEIGKGVVAFSSGNHAQALAIAAALRGASATLVMPSDAPRSKMDGVRSYGGRIVTFDRLKDDRVALGRRIAEETGATLVPPFDHPWIMAGQGTAVMELLEETGPLDALAVCAGGGGLIAGSAIAATAMQPAIRIFGIEPEIANDWALSFAAGKQVEIPPPATIADGLRSPKPGDLTFPVVRKLVERIVLVSEQEIIDALKFLLLRMKLLAEPSGAVAAAAVLAGKLPPEVKTVGVVISGGNVDWDLLKTL